MKTTDVTCGQLEKVLHTFGFVSRPGNETAPGRIYEHHLVAARTELDNFAIADPTTFEAKLRKAG
jgi:hypothetical protein